MKLTADEREFVRVVFAETGGIRGKYAALTELPVAAEALSIRGLIDLRRSGPDTWVVALMGEGSAWAHLRTPEEGACSRACRGARPRRSIVAANFGALSAATAATARKVERAGAESVGASSLCASFWHEDEAVLATLAARTTRCDQGGCRDLAEPRSTQPAA